MMRPPIIAPAAIRKAANPVGKGMEGRITHRRPGSVISDLAPTAAAFRTGIPGFHPLGTRQNDSFPKNRARAAERNPPR